MTSKPERQPGRLILEDGLILEGEGFGATSPAAGEVVFNTGMVGYPESLTDPSYRGQILVFTYPLLGNYGVPHNALDVHGLPRLESEKVQAAGVVVWECSPNHSHHDAHTDLAAWLKEHGVPGLSGIDTRALTKRLRARGTMLGRLEPASEEIPFFDPNAADLVGTVSVRETVRYEGGKAAPRPKVVLLDCGCKASIIRSLLERGLDVVRVPHDHYFLSEDFDGLVISNGPGDPERCQTTIRNVERALAVGKPILGICLGHQILALAVGAETYKLPFGHRSQNQPCIEQRAASTTTTRCVITSQNHGFAVREKSLPEDWQLWFLNANDGTVDGIRHRTKAMWGVQFHPEARPGPVDTSWIFDDFAREVARRLS
jgi:carbamoyl-phosphate synthase small subunit